ncbi:UpxY family transcription antiterminator [Bacteroides thetaiotaomicron]|uniref:UpxY family transcription antiterminator n=1 Tax=Bacteroides thetaiotaomicron TaxID=818 RepID=UPI0039C4636C
MNDLDKERQTEGRKAWYAVQTFYCKEEHLGKYLEKKGVNYFIPMRYIEHETLDGKKHRKLTPAVHNLLFIEKEFTEKELLERVKDCTIPFLLVRDRSTRRCYEIPDCEMLEFRAVCDPNYKGTLYVDTVTAEARPGQAVRVIRGPFAGLEGKLTQYKKSYYVVVTLATIGVMLHIPKWYCEKSTNHNITITFKHFFRKCTFVSIIEQNHLLMILFL